MPEQFVELPLSSEDQKARLLIPPEFAVMKDGTEYGELDLGSRYLRAGLVRIPPGRSTDAHSHHETEIFLLVQGKDVSLDACSKAKLVAAGDVALVPPFHIHKLHNLGSESALVCNMYFEETEVYERAAIEAVRRHQSADRSINVLDLRREPHVLEDIDFLVGAFYQQGWHVAPATEADDRDASSLLSDFDVSSGDHGAIFHRMDRTRCIASLGRFGLSRSASIHLETALSEDLEYANRGPLTEAAQVASMIDLALKDPKPHYVVAFDALDTTRLLPALSLVVNSFGPNADLSRVVLFPQVAGELQDKIERLERAYFALSENILKRVSEAFHGVTPVPGRWTEDHLSVFEEFDRIQRKALGLLDPARFSSYALISLLEDSLNITSEIWSRSPWRILQGERFESEARTTTALAILGLYQLSVFAAPLGALFSRPLSLGLGPFPGTMPWAGSRQLLSGIELSS